uniref:Uncharacterized protein n=1 Tax=viral metagenome TaxID=1070528 RepID=A0A6H1ZJ84_9ZZZZ
MADEEKTMEKDLLDEFAMAALQGMLARSGSKPPVVRGMSDKSAAHYAAAAYEFASAMIEERKLRARLRADVDADSSGRLGKPFTSWG